MPQKKSRRIGSDGFGRVASQFDAFAVGQHSLYSENVVGRHTVFQTMRPTGVEGQISPDGADLLAAGVGGVIQPVWFSRLAHLQVYRSRFHNGEAIFRVELQDAIQPVQANDHPSRHRHGAPGKTGAASPRHKGSVVSITQADGLNDFLLRIGYHHGQRLGPERGQPIRLIGNQLGFLGEEAVRRKQPL